jgi:hypothetical protein
MSGQPEPNSTRRWRVTVIEWLSHKAVIEADTAEEAEAKAEQLWAEDMEAFSFSDGGLDGVVVDEM